MVLNRFKTMPQSVGTCSAIENSIVIAVMGGHLLAKVGSVCGISHNAHEEHV